MSKKSTYHEIRQAAGQSGSTCPVKIIDGNTEPKLTGESWCYRTRGGSYIYHPSAYSKNGWSNMVYHPSTRCIEVGREWIIKNAPEIFGRIMIERLKA